jgi:hypothetical protein
LITPKATNHATETPLFAKTIMMLAASTEPTIEYMNSCLSPLAKPPPEASHTRSPQNLPREGR